MGRLIKNLSRPVRGTYASHVLVANLERIIPPNAGKGEREAARQTVAQLCPTACNSNCTNLPYRDLQPSTLKTLGFDFWVNDDHFMNPDRGY